MLTKIEKDIADISAWLMDPPTNWIKLFKASSNCDQTEQTWLVTEVGSEILQMIDKEKHQELLQQELLHQELLHQELLHQESLHQELLHQELLHQELLQQKVNSSDHQLMVNQGSRVEPKAFQVYLTHHRIFYSNESTTLEDLQSEYHWKKADLDFNS